MSSRTIPPIRSPRPQFGLSPVGLFRGGLVVASLLGTLASAAQRPQWSPQRTWTTRPVSQSRPSAVASTATAPIDAAARTQDLVPFQPSTESASYAQRESAPVVRYDAAPVESCPGQGVCSDLAPASSCAAPYYAAPVLTSGGTAYDGYPYAAAPGLFDQDIVSNRLVVRADYLLWWSEAQSVTPLVTTADAGTPPATAGVLDEPTTDILSGGARIKHGAQSGGRIALQYWFDAYQLWAVEGSYLGMGRKTASFSATSDERPILARPYFDVTGGAEAAMLVAHPDFTVGSVAVSAPTEFNSIEALLRRALIRQNDFKADALFGWRYARLHESLRIEQFTEWTAPQFPFVVDTTRSAFDLFDTKNTFNGFEFGMELRRSFGPWSLDVLAKLGLGHTRSVVSIDGQTVTTDPGVEPVTIAGDLLAQRTNMGRHVRNDFAVLPELGLTLGYQLTPRFQLRAGYTFLYWSNVARPAGQIDRDVSQLPPNAPAGARRPALTLVTDDYWMQGANFGGEFRF